MLKCSGVLVGLALLGQAQDHPPQILEVNRQILRPGSEPAYTQVAHDAAQVCSALKCPHPYLCIESLTGPPQAWCLNGYDSREEIDSVRRAYQANGPLTAALNDISKRHRPQLLSEDETFLPYRPALSAGTPWSLGRGRFLVITETRGTVMGEGAVFEGDDGTRLVIRPAQTRAAAERLVAVAGRGANIFAVRPDWSMAAKDWVARDSAFWQTPGRSLR